MTVLAELLERLASRGELRIEAQGTRNGVPLYRVELVDGCRRRYALDGGPLLEEALAALERDTRRGIASQWPPRQQLERVEMRESEAR